MSEPGIFEITLLRHAESEGNVAKTPQGHSDQALTELGRKQAAALASRWAAEGRQFDHITSSPLQRATDTAMAVGEALGRSVELDEIWLERDVGQMSELQKEEVDRRYENPISRSPFQDAFGLGAEGQWQLYLRAGQALQVLLQREPGRYLVVSHGGLLNALIYSVLGIAPDAYGHGPRFIIRNCGFTDLLYKGDHHQWTLLGFNDRAHLRDLNG